MNSSDSERIFHALEMFRLEIPSWGFANTGTRFGKFLQPAAASTTREKFCDAAQVQRVTGVCPTIALHVLWDFPQGIDSTKEIADLSTRHGIQPGSINRIFFKTRFTSTVLSATRMLRSDQHALQHTKNSIEIARRLHSRDISMWFADGSSYPGTANIRRHKLWFEETLKEVHAQLSSEQRLLVEI